MTRAKRSRDPELNTGEYFAHLNVALETKYLFAEQGSWRLGAETCEDENHMFDFEFNGPVNTIKVKSSQSVHVNTLFS